MNFYGIWAIYRFEMARSLRTLFQSLVSPVISTSLYFIVFGAAIGSRIQTVDGVAYGAFIVPGLIMLSLITNSLNNASFGIHMPKFSGTIFEILSAPISAFEIVIGYVGAAATKSIVIGLVTLLTAKFFVPLEIKYPIIMLIFIIITSINFSLFGFIIGIWATNWEKLNLIPLVIVTPLVFLGGTFYNISMLPNHWQLISKLNPVFYLINGFRWSFFGQAEISLTISLFFVLSFMTICVGAVIIIFKTGFRIRQ